MRQALTELQIMSLNASFIYFVLGYVAVTGVMIAAGIGAYDWWMNRHPRK